MTYTSLYKISPDEYRLRNAAELKERIYINMLSEIFRQINHSIIFDISLLNCQISFNIYIYRRLYVVKNKRVY